jgi:4a-hydroxytetrahydrobiopterin dehydratase
MTDLTQKRCVPCEGGAAALTLAQAQALLQQTPGWSLSDDAKEIHRVFEFKNYYQTMAFVNALAWVAHQEDHHPDLEVGYKRCRVRYSTHAMEGLSENDFICAAKLNALSAR